MSRYLHAVAATVDEHGGVTAAVPDGVGWVGQTDGVAYLILTDTPLDGAWLHPGEVPDPPEWRPNEQVEAGDLRAYEGAVYRCIQSHRTQGGWRPPSTPALWTVHREDGAPWVQPTMAEDAYPAGALVSHDGRLWRSRIDANTTTPGSDDRWWAEVARVVDVARGLIDAGAPLPGEADPSDVWRLRGA